MAARDEARRVHAAMLRLPAEHRAVLSLLALEGLSHREVAEVLGVPEGTVWSRLHAARRRLSEVLRP
jgi:RNA polymerase sigma-70 factor (ECF subfamily)